MDQSEALDFNSTGGSLEPPLKPKGTKMKISEEDFRTLFERSSDYRRKNDFVLHWAKPAERPVMSENQVAYEFSTKTERNSK